MVPKSLFEHNLRVHQVGFTLIVNPFDDDLNAFSRSKAWIIALISFLWLAKDPVSNSAKLMFHVKLILWTQHNCQFFQTIHYRKLEHLSLVSNALKSLNNLGLKLPWNSLKIVETLSIKYSWVLEIIIDTEWVVNVTKCPSFFCTHDDNNSKCNIMVQ